MKVVPYIDGVEVNDPNNLLELSIDVTYDKDGNKRSSSINNWDFGVADSRKSNDAVSILTKRKTDGLSGGLGVTEGMPYILKLIDEKGTSYDIFNGYIDIWKAKFRCDNIVAPAVEQGNIDWINDAADSVSFEYLYDAGVITNNDFISIPYCINKKQNATEIIITLVSVFVITETLKQQIIALQQKATESANPFQSATAIAGLIIQIAYVIVLFLTLIKLLLDLYYMVIQPVKYHNGMYAKDLMEKGLSHFGLTLSSSILKSSPFNELLIVPEKYNIKETNTGYLKNVVGSLLPVKNEKRGYYKGTFGDFLRALKTMFNAKIIIQNGVMYFERQDFVFKPGKYQLPPVYNPDYELNWDEFYSNYRLSFLYDINDKNTIQNFAGNEYQVIQQPIAVNNKKMLLMRNLQDVSIPFARGIRKESLNFLETILDEFFNVIGAIIDVIINVVNAIIKAVNAIIKAVNKLIKLLSKIGINLGGSIPSIPSIQSPNIQNLISNRVGMLVMESDYVATPKIMLITNNSNAANNKVNINNNSYINALYIYDNFHYFNNFVTTKGWNNQGIIKTAENIPFTFTDYEDVRSNGNILDENGNDCILQSLKFNPLKQKATVSYKKKEIYTNNIKLTTLYPHE